MMESAYLNDCWVVRIDPGEEITAALRSVCEREGIVSGIVSGIGAVGKAVVGLFRTETKAYVTETLVGDHEIVHLAGNVTEKDGKPYLHLHIALADETYHVRGGHLSEGVVSATCEVFIFETKGKISRRFDDASGLNLMRFS